MTSVLPKICYRYMVELMFLVVIGPCDVFKSGLFSIISESISSHICFFVTQTWSNVIIYLLGAYVHFRVTKLVSWHHPNLCTCTG